MAGEDVVATSPPDLLQQVVEAALLVSPEPLTLERLQSLFVEDSLLAPAATGLPPDAAAVRAALDRLAAACGDRGYELVRVASGYRLQVKQSLARWIGRLYAERPARYSRALLETLALIAYRQPVTRGDIEEVRGVAVATTIMRTLLERGWIRVVGHREVPGRPAMYGTTREFLDYFNLRALEDLPALDRLLDPDARADALQLSLGLAGDDPALVVAGAAAGGDGAAGAGDGRTGADKAAGAEGMAAAGAGAPIGDATGATHTVAEGGGAAASDLAAAAGLNASAWASDLASASDLAAAGDPASAGELDVAGDLALAGDSAPAGDQAPAGELASASDPAAAHDPAASLHAPGTAGAAADAPAADARDA
jgi:segregation and condensation protein B